ncbi:hypothetical protein [Streptomyces sp. WMMB 322]|uniref:hypothetical protein n=1 Tax=Streptomyces sp. WMMB 322 TaxID=1286821 RepID=UPI0006E2B4AB|nr:hypothetical protein [Streptomyces sp. WMMB 322]SCK06005.1 hypothetical protein H180DRAFT_00132 [Streptomyces sp. WMMB 322]
MLNERTADVAVDARPERLSTSSTVASLRLIADFLEGFPGLPDLYVVVHTDGSIGVQVSEFDGEPGERCKAVARIAQEAGGIALVKPLNDRTWSFETQVLVSGRQVQVYAPVEGPATGRGGDAA